MPLPPQPSSVPPARSSRVAVPSLKHQQADKGGAWETEGKGMNSKRTVIFAPPKWVSSRWDPLLLDGEENIQMEQTLKSFTQKNVERFSAEKQE